MEVTMRGALSFWDALPQIPGDHLAVDIMTPHQSHYYQPRRDDRSGSTSPHDSGAPNPHQLPHPAAGHGLYRCVMRHTWSGWLPTWPTANAGKPCSLPRLNTLLSGWAGAKTAVGYGAMQVNERARQQRAQASRSSQSAAHVQPLACPAADRGLVAELRTKHEQFPSYKEKPNAAFHNQARALAKAAHEGTDWSDKSARLPKP